MSYGTMSESTIDDDFVMPIACCDDYDWEDNDTSYNLGNLFGTNLGNYDDNNCYTVGVIHTINDESDYAYDMPSHKLVDAMFDENDMFDNLFAAINVCPKLGEAAFNEDDIFSLPSFDMQIYNDDSMPPTYDDYCADTYAIKVVIIFIKLVMIMITLFLNITHLMWKQFIVFESLMILALLLMWRVIKILCL